MKKIIFSVLLFPFFVFADDFYDCKFAKGDKGKNNLKYMGDGTVWVANDRFIAHDYIKNEYKSPKFTKFKDNLSIAEDSQYVYALANDRTNYAIASKTDSAIFQWSNCTLDLSVDFKNAKYGSKPVNFLPKIKSYFREVLKDPDSTKYSDVSKPQKDFMFEYKNVVTGYSVCLYVNAKNSFGGYTGRKLYWAFLKDNKLLRVMDAGDSKRISRWHNISCNY